MLGPDGTLIIIDEFHKGSLHVVFILAFQRYVDHVVIIWNVHMVYKIIENGRFILFCVLVQVFQPREREFRQVIHTYYATFRHMI
jgi:hypothetical protein